MSLTRDDFEHWLIAMDDQLERFLGTVGPRVADKLDYSPKSLSALEEWLLARYKSIKALTKSSEKEVLDGAARYVGETFRKSLGGTWNIDLKDTDNVYYKMPVLRERQGEWTECPVTVVTAAMDRRTGTYMKGVLDSYIEDYGTSSG